MVSHGKVVEQGTHTELMANGPVYQQMWRNYLREKKETITIWIKISYLNGDVKTNPDEETSQDSQGDALQHCKLSISQLKMIKSDHLEELAP